MAVIDRILSSNPNLQERFFFLAKRFVAGETIDDAIAVVRRLNDLGMTATLDYLGEDVLERSAALATRDAYFRLLDALANAGARSNVSVKLTALGLLIDEDFALANLSAILERASNHDTARPLLDSFVRIDMEGTAVTDATLRVFEEAFVLNRNVGPVLQAYLRRTPHDIEHAIELGARVRLCKGAYKEPATVAHHEMATIRREYMRCAEALLTRGTYPGIATHDERIIDAVKAFVAEREIDRTSFEFQLLYGVRPDVQRRLVEEGFNVRIYIPYGTHWAGYFYRRMTERKENALFALRSILSK